MARDPNARILKRCLRGGGYVRFTAFTLMPLRRCISLTAASLAGRLVDSSGAAIPQAELMVVCRTLGTRWNTLSNRSGQLRVDSLPAGFYLIEASVEGLSM